MSNQDYLALRKKWYQKLKDKGFKDLEDEKGQLKAYATHNLNPRNPAAFEEHRRYFELAGHLFHDHTFKNAVERKVWGLHAEGATVAEISKRAKVPSTTAFKMIKRLAALIKV